MARDGVKQSGDRFDCITKASTFRDKFVREVAAVCAQVNDDRVFIEESDDEVVPAFGSNECTHGYRTPFEKRIKGRWKTVAMGLERFYLRVLSAWRSRLASKSDKIVSPAHDEVRQPSETERPCSPCCHRQQLRG